MMQFHTDKDCFKRYTTIHLPPLSIEGGKSRSESFLKLLDKLCIASMRNIITLTCARVYKHAYRHPNLIICFETITLITLEQLFI